MLPVRAEQWAHEQGKQQDQMNTHTHAHPIASCALRQAGKREEGDPKQGETTVAGRYAYLGTA